MNKPTPGKNKNTKNHDAMAKADKAREHSQIDESGARLDQSDTKNDSKTSDRKNKPDPRKM